MKTTGNSILLLIGLTLSLLHTSCSQAQYGRPDYQAPPSRYDRPDYDQYGNNQPGYNQPGYGDDYYDGDFYDDLAPHGQWVRTPEYGMVWIPNAEPGFQPYASNGRWIVTDYGNTWVSDYAWGWAPFHYGRWYQDRFNRWAWVPGREWGPAWVSWRSGGGYYGWAPLGPGINVNVNVNIPPAWWTFVPQMYINSPRVYGYCVPRRQVVNVYQNTTIINNFHYGRNNRAYAYGPRREEIETVTRQRVPVYRIENTGRPGRDEVRQNTIGIYRPEGNRNGRSSDYGRTNDGNYRNRDNGNYGRRDNGGYNRDNNGNNRDNNGTPQRDPSYGGNSRDSRPRYEAPSQPNAQPQPERPAYGQPQTERPSYQRPQSSERPSYGQPQPERPGYQRPERPDYQRPQQQERLETMPQPGSNGPGFGGRRGSGVDYAPPRENTGGPGMPQRSQQPQRDNQPMPSQNQPEQRMRNYERRAQEADQNTGGGQQTPNPNPGNGGRSRGPR